MNLTKNEKKQILSNVSYVNKNIYIRRIENSQNLKSKAGVLKVTGTLICIMGAIFLTFYKGPEISNPHSHPGALHNNNNTLHNNGHDQTKKWLLGCLYLIIGAVLLSLWMLFQGKLSVKYPCNKYSSTCLMSVFAAFQCAILSLYKSREVEDWIIEDKFVIFIILYAVSLCFLLLLIRYIHIKWELRKLLY